MNKSSDMNSNEIQCVDGLRLIFQGMAMMFGTMAEALEGIPQNSPGHRPLEAIPDCRPGSGEADKNYAAAPATVKVTEPAVKPVEESAGESTGEPGRGLVGEPTGGPGGGSAVAPAGGPTDRATEDEPGDSVPSISRTDVERAMMVKIKALTTQGKGLEAIQQMFPMFHGARCVSDLRKEDYPAFLDELSKL